MSTNEREAIRALRAEIALRKNEIARFEAALALLVPPEPNGDQPKRGRPKGSTNKPKPKGIGTEKLEIIEKAIRAFAEDHDEFRQVDIRMNSSIDKSSTMALAFEQLRQQGMIRFARREGIQKFYRLTESARRDNAQSARTGGNDGDE